MISKISLSFALAIGAVSLAHAANDFSSLEERMSQASSTRQDWTNCPLKS
jgi:hypothetical protein